MGVLSIVHFYTGSLFSRKKLLKNLMEHMLIFHDKICFINNRCLSEICNIIMVGNVIYFSYNHAEITVAFIFQMDNPRAR